MVRNGYIAKTLVFFCFGTAILSLITKWYVDSSAQSKTAMNRPHETSSRVKTSEARTTGIARISPQNRTVDNLFDLFSIQTVPQKSIKSNPASGPIKVTVDLSDRRVYVYRGNTTIASYPTGIGKKGWETPTGSFQVNQKVVNPSWRHPITDKVFPPGPDSPLGLRWIGFWSDGRNYIGFHGTPNYDVVGTAVSHGCLRMRNVDVLMLYKQVTMGTPVEVRQ
nr:L,D-transpeptidase [Mastigocoleus testarum]